MKSTTFALTALCAGLAAASPLDKRAWATTYELYTVTVTVTGYPPAETPAAPVDNAAAPGWGDWHGGWGGDSAAPTSAAPVAAAAPTTQAANAAPTDSSWGGHGAPSSGGSPASPAGPPSGPASPVSTSVSSDYQQGILDSHNIHRQNASVPDLTWSDDMAAIAAQIAASCVYAHDTSAGGGGYGQNIGAGAPPSGIPAMITDEMYNGEINFYPAYGVEPDMSNFEKWGHYSQIVWKSTTAVGCATQYCPGGLANTGGNVSPYFTVCNYSPPGT